MNSYSFLFVLTTWHARLRPWQEALLAGEGNVALELLEDIATAYKLWPPKRKEGKRDLTWEIC